MLHRKKLVNQRHPFERLKDENIRVSFNKELLNLLQVIEYSVITAVIDKLEHNQRYKAWRFDPYHYCLQVIVERYVLWLRQNEFVGDVIAESRGGKEDRRLKDSFHRLYSNGSDYLESLLFAQYLTSCQLKVKPKSTNIAGLQLADLIAHPSYKATLALHIGQELPSTFGGEIAKILESSKYNRSPDGTIDGWGRKWLP